MSKVGVAKVLGNNTRLPLVHRSFFELSKQRLADWAKRLRLYSRDARKTWWGADKRKMRSEPTWRTTYVRAALTRKQPSRKFDVIYGLSADFLRKKYSRRGNPALYSILRQSHKRKWMILACKTMRNHNSVYLRPMVVVSEGFRNLSVVLGNLRVVRLVKPVSAMRLTSGSIGR